MSTVESKKHPFYLEEQTEQIVASVAAEVSSKEFRDRLRNVSSEDLSPLALETRLVEVRTPDVLASVGIGQPPQELIVPLTREQVLVLLANERDEKMRIDNSVSADYSAATKKGGEPSFSNARRQVYQPATNQAEAILDFKEALVGHISWDGPREQVTVEPVQQTDQTGESKQRKKSVVPTFVKPAMKAAAGFGVAALALNGGIQPANAEGNQDIPALVDQEVQNEISPAQVLHYLLHQAQVQGIDVRPIAADLGIKDEIIDALLPPQTHPTHAPEFQVQPGGEGAVSPTGERVIVILDQPEISINLRNVPTDADTWNGESSSILANLVEKDEIAITGIEVGERVSLENGESSQLWWKGSVYDKNGNLIEGFFSEALLPYAFMDSETKANITALLVHQELHNPERLPTGSANLIIINPGEGGSFPRNDNLPPEVNTAIATYLGELSAKTRNALELDEQDSLVLVRAPEGLAFINMSTNPDGSTTITQPLDAEGKTISLSDPNLYISKTKITLPPGTEIAVEFNEGQAVYVLIVDGELKGQIPIGVQLNPENPVTLAYFKDFGERLVVPIISEVGATATNPWFVEQSSGEGRISLYTSLQLLQTFPNTAPIKAIYNGVPGLTMSSGHDPLINTDPISINFSVSNGSTETSEQIAQFFQNYYRILNDNPQFIYRKDLPDIYGDQAPQTGEEILSQTLNYMSSRLEIYSINDNAQWNPQNGIRIFIQRVPTVAQLSAMSNDGVISAPEEGQRSYEVGPDGRLWVSICTLGDSPIELQTQLHALLSAIMYQNDIGIKEGNNSEYITLNPRSGFRLNIELAQVMYPIYNQSVRIIFGNLLEQ